MNTSHYIVRHRAVCDASRIALYIYHDQHPFQDQNILTAHIPAAIGTLVATDSYHFASAGYQDSPFYEDLWAEDDRRQLAIPNG